MESMLKNKNMNRRDKQENKQTDAKQEKIHSLD
jgi:hypothetical protein